MPFAPCDPVRGGSQHRRGAAPFRSQPGAFIRADPRPAPSPSIGAGATRPRGAKRAGPHRRLFCASTVVCAAHGACGLPGSSANAAQPTDPIAAVAGRPRHRGKFQGRRRARVFHRSPNGTPPQIGAAHPPGCCSQPSRRAFGNFAPERGSVRATIRVGGSARDETQQEQPKALSTPLGETECSLASVAHGDRSSHVRIGLRAAP
jgi:hypothetical protein